MELFLSANVHQGEVFSIQSRGKQCAFLSLSAILTALLKKPKHMPNIVLLEAN